jgi:Flp pilus assembly protein TadD
MMVWASDERLWTEAVERAPEQLRPRIQLARSLEPPRALQELRNAQQRYPNSTEIDEELGRVYLKQGQPALALAEFGKVLGQKPDDPHAINNRGVALLSLGQADAAKQDFERALKFAPCLREARANLGLPPCAE